MGVRPIAFAIAVFGSRDAVRVQTRNVYSVTSAALSKGWSCLRPNVGSVNAVQSIRLQVDLIPHRELLARVRLPNWVFQAWIEK